MGSRIRYALVAACLAAPALEIHAQIAPRPFPSPVGPLPTVRSLFSEDDRSGPRLGVAYLVGGSVTADNAGRRVAPLTTLFGWQVEHQFRTGQSTLPIPMTELVVLVGGMEQGAFLPSVTWMLGARKPNGWEVGAGPTLTGAGVQLAVAAGVTRTLGTVNVPLNLAVAPGRRGASISITTGFNVKNAF